MEKEDFTPRQKGVVESREHRESDGSEYRSQFGESSCKLEHVTELLLALVASFVTSES